jgi:catechol 2,3-dioxygenase
MLNARARESIDPGTTIGEIHLTISDLDRSVAFYTDRLGFRVRRRDGDAAHLGAGGPDLLVLVRTPAAPRVRGTTGLYHFAILVPSRADLARSLRRLADTDTVMQGFADHGVSEALYLADPDGNGIEIYRDRPRAEWPMANGALQMTADPVDLDDLIAAAPPTSGQFHALAAGTVIGHVHLHVGNLVEAEAFYVGVLGFDLMQRYGPNALFVSAGGYHHHVGLNTWAGVGAPPPPPAALGLRHFVVRLPTARARTRVVERINAARVPIVAHENGSLVHDPARNAILLS